MLIIYLLSSPDRHNNLKTCLNRSAVPIIHVQSIESVNITIGIITTDSHICVTYHT